jgi:hypothetical protein
MTTVVAVLVSVAALAGGMIIGMFGAMGMLIGAVLLVASAVVSLFLPFL